MSQYPDLLLPKAMPPAKLPASPDSAIHPHANTLQPPSTTAPALTRLPLEHHGKPLQSKQHFSAQHYMRPHSLCKSGSNAALGAASRKELLWARTTTSRCPYPSKTIFGVLVLKREVQHLNTCWCSDLHPPWVHGSPGRLGSLDSRCGCLTQQYTEPKSPEAHYGAP